MLYIHYTRAWKFKSKLQPIRELYIATSLIWKLGDKARKLGRLFLSLVSMPWFIVVQSWHPRFWFLWIINCYPIKKTVRNTIHYKKNWSATILQWLIMAYVCFVPANYPQFLHFFQVCDLRPGCHHHFDASGTSNAMFDELAERSLMSPLARTKHT